MYHIIEWNDHGDITRRPACATPYGIAEAPGTPGRYVVFHRWARRAVSFPTTLRSATEQAARRNRNINETGNAYQSA